MVTYKEFLKALEAVKKFKEQISDLHRDVEDKVGTISNFIGVDKDTKIYRLPLSKRTMNILREMNQIDFLEGTTKDLAKISLKELSRTKNAGRKTIDEIKKLCLFANLEMKT
ncbi:hypothetical protein K8352_15005 [Flavobacteriaceae bacterium F89]|uniref:RNA polymerase alpha subunit C-terminal domain-containing protein n=1 Tax=Cerina litoralis TaxID=2874477 RepID=A0AAE3EYJ4_9FLAO|nr:DNA-directed RNA polymerase subunit alpha C-terminal domain-containing protein [Cerina litoralis]MCG2462067.1 hypothetical protein [Cerina litoralis]